MVRGKSSFLVVKGRLSFFACEVIGYLLFFLFFLTTVFGCEPQITGAYTHLCITPNFTYTQYREAVLHYNGDTMLTRVLTPVAYPGAKVGRLIHNSICDD